MIFKQIAEILDGRKTQTRRIRKPDEWHDGEWVFDTISRVEVIKEDEYRGRLKWAVGRKYAIIPKRGAAGIGRHIEIVDIRIEPLQAITEADAIAEGVGSVEEYKALWESINGKDKANCWAANPRVWILTFKLVEDAKLTANDSAAQGG